MVRKSLKISDCIMMIKPSIENNIMLCYVSQVELGKDTFNDQGSNFCFLVASLKSQTKMHEIYAPGGLLGTLSQLKHEE